MGAHLKKQLTVCTQELHDFRHQVEVITLERDHLTEELHNSEEERVMIAGEMSKASAIIDDLREQLRKSQSELSSLRDELSQQVAADVSEQYQESLKTIADLRANLDALVNVETENKSLQNEIDRLNNALSQLKDDMAKMQKELTKYEDLKIQFSDLDKAFHKLEGVHSACPSQLTLDELRDKLGDTEKSLMERNEKIKKLQGENDQMHEDLSNDDSDMAKLKAELRKAQQLLDIANKELKDMHLSYEKQAKELYDKNVEVGEKDHTIGDLRKILDDLSEELTKLQHDLKNNEETLKARDLEIEELKRQLALAFQNQPLVDENAKIAKYEAELDALRRQIEEANRKKKVTVVETLKPLVETPEPQQKKVEKIPEIST